jgi:hypothetical protein
MTSAWAKWSEPSLNQILFIKRFRVNNGIMRPRFDACGMARIREYTPG